MKVIINSNMLYSFFKLLTNKIYSRWKSVIKLGVFLIQIWEMNRKIFAPKEFYLIYIFIKLDFITPFEDNENESPIC